MRSNLNDSLDTKPVCLRTLDRGELLPEDYVDLSDVLGIAVDPEDPTPPAGSKILHIPYGRRQRFAAEGHWTAQYTAFPVNTLGFFYALHRQNTPVGGSIRFRVVQTPDPGLFSEGTDLLTEFGTPWQIPLLAIVGSGRYAVLRDVLMRSESGQFVRSCLEACAELKEKSTNLAARTRSGFGPVSQFIHELGEPFHLSLTSIYDTVFLAGHDKIYQLRAQTFLAHHDRYEAGVLRCRLEKLGGGIGVRVLRIVEPVRMKKDGSQEVFSYDEPHAGQLLTRNGHPRRFFLSTTSETSTAIRETLLRPYTLMRRA